MLEHRRRSRGGGGRSRGGGGIQAKEKRGGTLQTHRGEAVSPASDPSQPTILTFPHLQRVRSTMAYMHACSNEISPSRARKQHCKRREKIGQKNVPNIIRYRQHTGTSPNPYFSPSTHHSHPNPSTFQHTPPSTAAFQSIDYSNSSPI